jgi:hypothetical protein
MVAPNIGCSRRMPQLLRHEALKGSVRQGDLGKAGAGVFEVGLVDVGKRPAAVSTPCASLRARAAYREV